VVNALRMSEQRTGQGRHIEYVAQQWSRMQVPFDRIVLMSPGELRLEMRGNTTPIELQSFGDHCPRALWEQVLLPRKARRAAMLFCPSYTAPLLYPRPTVVANHGIYEALPKEFSRLTRLRATTVQRYAARRAQRVIANSLSTKRDLMLFFGLPDEKIDVVYPAAHDLFFQRHEPAAIEEEVARWLGKPVPYVIFVGKLAKRRHVPNLIEAFAIAGRENNFPHHLLIVGPNTSNVPVAALAQQHGVSDRVRYHPYAELQPLARLYAGADVFALPTIYEGISQTMFEAMASGTAVLTVEHPTLEEGAGDAALAMPTPAVPDLVRGLAVLLGNPGLRQAYAAKGRERAKKFSWETVARETMRILDRDAN
jgi:glycosyltransferase involved in cell wall biosynthesis